MSGARGASAAESAIRRRSRPGFDEDVDKDEGVGYPWEDVESSRRNEGLQIRHLADLPRAREELVGTQCPGCGRPSDELSCFYFESPSWSWEDLCGAAGWLLACDTCHLQVKFLARVVS